MPAWDVHFALAVKSSRPSLIRSLAEVRAFAGVIQGIPLPPYIERRLHALNIMRAVRGTTGIEGTELSEEEVEAVIGTPEGTPVLSGDREREERETRNAHALMRYVEGVLRDGPALLLTESLIRRFHATLTDGIAYPNNEPGRYRTANLTAGDYRAPEHTGVPTLMSGLISWLNEGQGRELDPIVRAVIAHFLLVSIHPFGDGNGRTSRAVESFLLYQAGVNARGFYSLANYYYQHRPEYVELLSYVRFASDPDVTPFVDFALKGLAAELREVHREVLASVRIFAFRDFARETLLNQGRLGTKTGERQLMFLFDLVGEEIPLRDLQHGAHALARFYRGVGAKTLSRDMNYLRSLGLLVLEQGMLRANVEQMDRFTAG